MRDSTRGVFVFWANMFKVALDLLFRVIYCAVLLIKLLEYTHSTACTNFQYTQQQISFCFRVLDAIE